MHQLKFDMVRVRIALGRNLMPTSQILDVAIGLVFAYLLLSTAASAIKEFIAGFFQLRGKMLEQALEQMLGPEPARSNLPGAPTADTDNLASLILKSPLVTAGARNGFVSYVHSKDFAATLLNAVGIVGNLGAEQLRNQIGDITNPRVKTILLAMLDAASNDVAKFRENLEDFYDHTMDRVSGWYIRQAQKILFAIGIVLCGALNADTVMMAGELWVNPTLRAAQVAAAETAVKGQKPVDNSAASATVAVVEERAADTQKSIRDTKVLPIGWKTSSEVPADPRLVHSLNDCWFWLWKIFGILLSAGAVTMGAPFWFDTLSKLVNVRSAGAKPNKAKDDR